jgi:hypothetical protein
MCLPDRYAGLSVLTFSRTMLVKSSVVVSESDTVSDSDTCVSTCINLYQLVSTCINLYHFVSNRVS